MALQKVKDKGVKGKKQPKTHRMRFDKWENMEVVEALYRCWAWLDLKDADTVEVEIPIGENDDDSPRWEWSLTELIKWGVDVCEDLAEDNKDKKRLQALSDHLGKLKGIVDAALAKGEET
jgi:hypothetical protein